MSAAKPDIEGGVVSTRLASSEFVDDLEAVAPSCDWIDPESIDPEALAELRPALAEAMATLARFEARFEGEPPPSVGVKSGDAERAARLAGERESAKRILHATGNPWAALRALGIVSETKPGRVGRSPQQLEQLTSLYEHLVHGAGPYRPRIFRTQRIDLLLLHSADAIAAQREGRPIPAEPDEAFYDLDSDVPMSPSDALRNVAAYLEVKPRRAWEILHRNGARDLPPRPK